MILIWLFLLFIQKTFFDNCARSRNNPSPKVKRPTLCILYMYIYIFHYIYILQLKNGFNRFYYVCVIGGWIKSVFFGWHRFYLVYLRYIIYYYIRPSFLSDFIDRSYNIVRITIESVTHTSKYIYLKKNSNLWNDTRSPIHIQQRLNKY